jgi:hypothetical protein
MSDVAVRSCKHPSMELASRFYSGHVCFALMTVNGTVLSLSRCDRHATWTVFLALRIAGLRERLKEGSGSNAAPIEFVERLDRCWVE